MADPFSAKELQERARNTAWMVENHAPDTEMNVQVQELDRLVSAAVQLEEAQAARDAAIERGVEAYEWGEIGWEYRCLVEILAADTRQAQAENERQREPCGKCRVQGLVLGEAKRLLQNLLAWVPDNDVRREAARFLRMSERRVRAALRGEPSHHGG